MPQLCPVLSFWMKSPQPWPSGAKESRLTGIPSVKFIAPIKPGQSFVIVFDSTNTAGTQIDFCCRLDGRVVVQGRLAISCGPVFNLHPRDPGLARWLQDYPPSLFNENIYRSIALMERYSIDLAIDLLGRLNVLERLDQSRSARDLCQTLSFQTRFGSTLGWLLERLVETGCIEVKKPNADRSYRLLCSPWRPQCAELRAIALEIDGANASTLDLLDYAANLYPLVAAGKQNGEQGLFLPQGITLWLNYFHNNNLTYAVNNWLGAVVATNLSG